MGSIKLTPPGPFVAGSHAELTLTYTAGTFGIDDTGMLKISWRTTSDMSKPQFDKPQAANFTTVEASNGAKLEVWFDRLNIRPYANTLLIRVGRGYLRAGDTLTIRFGDRRQGSPGYRLQTNVEERVELKTSVDAFATYEFCELPEQPAFDLVPGPAASWKAIWPSLAVVGEPFRLAIVAEDMWGNPTDEADATLALVPSRPLRGLPAARRDQARRRPARHRESRRRRGRRPRSAAHGGRRGACARQSAARGRGRAAAALLGRPARAERRDHRHGLGGSYFRYARDAAFIDIVGHQGNDFQITDAFWTEAQPADRANSTSRAVSSACRATNGPATPAWAATATSSSAARAARSAARRTSWCEGQTSTDAIYTADELFRALEGEDAVVIAHVGGRYADIKYAHDGRLERTVEVHSTWGTFEWLLHDAFEKGYRVGVVCHSDDHKGRPGATRPGASTFGAIGGLTCYFMPELTRDALFEALRQRRHYGTTGTRLFLDLRGTFDRAGDRLLGRPAARARRRSSPCAKRAWATSSGRARCRCGLRPRSSAPRRSSASTSCTARRWRKRCVPSRPPISAAACACCGRAPNIAAAAARRMWQGKLTLSGNRFARFAPVNFLNPERKVQETAPGTALAWTSVTTGNLAGIDLWLDEARRGTLRVETNVVSGEVDLASLADDTVAFDGGGLGRKLSVYRLPEDDWSRRVDARPHGDVLGRRGPPGLSARHAGRRPSGLVEPDLPDRVG